MKKIKKTEGDIVFYVFLANGFEEIEALAPVDLLRRAGIPVKTVGVGAQTVIGSKGITVQTDMTTYELDLGDCEGILLPGGMPGTENLFASEVVRNAVCYCVSHERLLCSICAAPSIPGRMGLLDGKTAVCFPGWEDKLCGAKIGADPVVRDGNVITARGAGTAFAFSHQIISALRNREVADRVIAEIQYADM